jgi:hypothetical protein
MNPYEERRGGVMKRGKTKRSVWVWVLTCGLVLSWSVLVKGDDFYVIPVVKKGSAKPAPVPKTGQTTLYQAGDDGDLEKGVAWPSPRFTDNGNGTVTDNLTGLIWTKIANCGGSKTWTEALDYCNAMANGACGLSDASAAGDWRLPNLRELQSLVHYGTYSPALPNTAGTGQWSEGDPFSNVQSGFYGSSSTSAYSADYAWYVNSSDGYVGSNAKGIFYYVWCVRGGQ